MNKDDAIEAAKIEAKKNKCDILVIESPLDVRSHNEHEIGSFGYCPDGAQGYLFAWGIIIGYADPKGEFHNHETPLVVEREKFDAIRESETFESIQCNRRNRVVPVLGSIYCGCPYCESDD